MALFKKKAKQKKDLSERGAFARGLAKTLATTSKQIVWLYTINSILWIWCSYILAFMDKYQVVETLSSTVCQICIGQLGFYLITSTVENIFKYNDLFGPRATYDNPSEPTFIPDTSSPISPPCAPTPPSAPTAPTIDSAPAIVTPIVNTPIETTEEVSTNEQSSEDTNYGSNISSIPPDDEPVG